MQVERKMKVAYFLLFTLVFLVLVSNVYADDGVNLTDLPQQLATQLGIPLFAAQLLTTAIILSLPLLPALRFTRGKTNQFFVMILLGFVTLGFCVAMTWLPVWMFVIISLVVALLFSDRLTSRF